MMIEVFGRKGERKICRARNILISEIDGRTRYSRDFVTKNSLIRIEVSTFSRVCTQFRSESLTYIVHQISKTF